MYNKQELRELQKVEVDILKEFIRVCDELQLDYTLEGGTLLGCIRHKGFIPWDDDIDVAMTRKDYEKFLEKGSKIIDSRYFIQNYKTDPEFAWAYTKIGDNNTTFIETIFKDRKMNHGVFIDVFPYDGYNPEKKFDNFYRKIKRILLNIQVAKYRYDPEKNKSLKKRLKTFIKNCSFTIISNIIYGNKNLNELISIQDKMAQKYSYEKSKFVSNQTDPVNIYNKKYFSKTVDEHKVLKEFEGMNVKVRKNYDEYLKIVYGDYMKLPPEEKRVPGHEVVKFDLKNSYKKYI